MTAPVAAAYMGVSQSTFWVRFRSIGAKEGGNTFWARAQLDQFIAEQFDLPWPTGESAPHGNSWDAEEEIAAWKARRGKR